jgi:hypothetical protein
VYGGGNSFASTLIGVVGVAMKLSAKSKDYLYLGYRNLEPQGPNAGIPIPVIEIKMAERGRFEPGFRIEAKPLANDDFVNG